MRSLPIGLLISLLCLTPLRSADLNILAAEYAGLPRPENADGSVRAEVVRSPDRNFQPPVSAGKKAWDAYQKVIGNPLQQWASSEIAAPGGGTVFYPFSGPDFVTVSQMFPQAERYVLAAIQPAGPVVDLAGMGDAAAGAFKSKFEAEWLKFGQLGFFRTMDLNENTANKVTPLTSTPVMMAFAAALGYRVESVRPLRMNEASGEFEPFEPEPKTRWSSVRLELKRDGNPVTLDYLCLDLSDDFLKSHTAELEVLRRLSRNPVLLKAASHLLPKPYFSVCRGVIVEGASLLVQDETGLEYEDLKKIGEVKLYGRFTGVLNLFDPNSQRSLEAAYAAAGTTTGALPFAYSYQKSADRRSLQVVRRASPAP